MNPENVQGVPPVICPPLIVPVRRQRAPTLYAIIAFKLLKGGLLLVAALVFYNMAGLDLQQEFARLVQQANFDAESKILNEVARWLSSVTPANVKVFATGTVLYSAFSLIEGTGLLLRATWAGWMAIGESAFFVPFELYHVCKSFTITLVVVLLLNVVIVWYLWVNRDRLFKHH